MSLQVENTDVQNTDEELYILKKNETAAECKSERLDVHRCSNMGSLETEYDQYSCQWGQWGQRVFKQSKKAVHGCLNSGADKRETSDLLSE